MKSNRLAVILLAAVALLLASLYALSFLAARKTGGKLLLATPNTSGAMGVGTDKLEEFSGDEGFLLTYAMPEPAAAEAVNSKHSVTLVKTNHNYSGLMGYATLDGGFFTKTAMDSKSKHVTLNETAAFKIFGSNRITGNSLKLNGETWLVTGVIQDNDTETLNLYIPAGVKGARADSVMVLTDATVTAAYAKNALKSIGINDNSYSFIDLSKSSKAFGERFWVALKAAISAAVLLFIIKSGGKLRGDIHFYRDSLREMYPGELLLHYRVDFIKTVCGLLAFAGGIAAVLALSLQILATCLTWQELAAITGELAAGEFGRALLWLRDYQLFSYILFWLCLGLVLLVFLLALSRRAGGGNTVANRHAPRYRVYYW